MISGSSKIDVNLERLVSGMWYDSFDNSKEKLEGDGFRIISLEENALLRIQQGKDVDVSRYGNWTKEGFLCIPKKGVYLVKHSPVLDHVKKATDTCKKNDIFYICKKHTEKVLEFSVKIPYSTRKPYKDTIFIPTESFDNNEVTNYIFGDQAKAYGEFLKEFGINVMPVCAGNKDFVNKQKQTFVKQVWFCGLNYGSELRDFRNLSSGAGLRGIKD